MQSRMSAERDDHEKENIVLIFFTIQNIHQDRLIISTLIGTDEVIHDNIPCMQRHGIAKPSVTLFLC